MEFEQKIHPTALIHPNSKLHPSVKVGAYSIIGQSVEIDKGSEVGNFVTITGNTVIGKTIPNSQEVLNLSAAQEIDKAINNIDRDLFTRSTSGTNGGKLTDKGQQILYDFLSAYDYEMYE